MIEINENYEGLTKTNEYYIYDGNLHFDGIVKITIPLVIRGSLFVGEFLKVGSWLEVGEYLEVGSWLKVGEYLEVGSWLKVGEYLKVGGYLEVGEHLEVGGFLKVGSWLEVGSSLDVGGFLEVGEYRTILNLPTKNCFLISSKYHITALDTHLKIGCKLYTYEEWENFTDKELLEMDGKTGLKWFRQNKHWLLKFNQLPKG